MKLRERRISVICGQVSITSKGTRTKAKKETVVGKTTVQAKNVGTFPESGGGGGNPALNVSRK